MLNVACVNCGTAYSNKYVEVLCAMVHEYLGMPFKFFCMTDRHREVTDCVHLLDAEEGLPGYWNKVSLFRRGLFSGPVLYFDLDIVIKKPLSFVKDSLRDLESRGFVSIKGFSGLPTYNSSVMLWDPEQCYDIHDLYTKRCIRAFPTDQEYITAVKGLGSYFPEEEIVSYKLGGEKAVGKASVVVFHGRPKPHELDSPLTSKWWTD